jgi:hypothetical protein
VVPRRVLPPDGLRIVEHAVGDEVGEEAEHVDGGEVDGRPGGAAAGEVQEGLWVEAERPGEGVDPAEGGGEGGEEGERHGRGCGCWVGGRCIYGALFGKLSLLFGVGCF